MSYPSRFFKLCISDDGTQRMARGEDNVGSCVNEGPFSTSSEDVPSRVYATRVITWLRPDKESQANAFWEKFTFPPNVRVSFPSSRPHFADYTEEDQG